MSREPTVIHEESRLLDVVLANVRRLDSTTTVADHEKTLIELRESLAGERLVDDIASVVEATRATDDQALVHTGPQTIGSIGGVGNPAQGYYAGLPGKVFAKSFEDAGGNTGVWFTEAVAIAEDTRIPALATDST